LRVSHERMAGALRALGLSKTYGKVSVLNSLDFDIPAGCVFGLIGPNGAGKTTTIKIMMNILQPTLGSVEMFGVDSRRLGPDDLTQIGYVSENQEMPGWMTVKYLMNYLKPFDPTWDVARAAELVQHFELPLDRELKNFSRGMWMKAALASALAYRPKLLVLDEPFTGLDPLVREDLVNSLAASAGETTIFVSSHDLGELETFATHVGYLHAGRLSFSEEMSSLSSRFRQVEVTLAAAPGAAAEAGWPRAWLRREVAGNVVRFVESKFEQERTSTEIGRVFGEPPQVSIQPMPLRAIFLTLARHSGKAA
jgi:ABC-2 type transport system ATP-binding protein